MNKYWITNNKKITKEWVLKAETALFGLRKCVTRWLKLCGTKCRCKWDYCQKLDVSNKSYGQNTETTLFTLRALIGQFLYSIALSDSAASFLDASESSNLGHICSNVHLMSENITL